jgi:hypothetical protein
VELATGALPSRAVKAIPTERVAGPWGEFLQRVLPSTVHSDDSDVLSRSGAEMLPQSGALAEGRGAAATVDFSAE